MDGKLEMIDIIALFTIGCVTLTVYMLYLIREIREELNRLQDWADNVDEFIESEFIELEIDLEDK